MTSAQSLFLRAWTSFIVRSHAHLHTRALERAVITLYSGTGLSLSTTWLAHLSIVTASADLDLSVVKFESSLSLPWQPSFVPELKERLFE